MPNLALHLDLYLVPNTSSGIHTISMTNRQFSEDIFLSDFLPVIGTYQRMDARLLVTPVTVHCQRLCLPAPFYCCSDHLLGQLYVPFPCLQVAHQSECKHISKYKES